MGTWLERRLDPAAPCVSAVCADELLWGEGGHWGPPRKLCEGQGARDLLQARLTGQVVELYEKGAIPLAEKARELCLGL